MAAGDSSWMPATGRHGVKVGTSLVRALKARKGVAPTKRSTLPDRDFYSFRYNFKPESIDPTKPGFIDVKRGKDSTSVTVERPSTQAGEFHLFNGTEQQAKDWECVLIYDDETGTYTLEKLDAFMILNYDKKSATPTLSRSSTTGSPAPVALHLAPAPTGPVPDLDFEARLEREFADAEAEDDFEEVLPKAPSEDGEEVEELNIPSRVPSPPAPKPSKSSNPRARSPAIPVAKSKPSQGRAKAKPKRDRGVVSTTDDVEEEELTFGQPARPAKRSRGTSLALPTKSSTPVTRDASRPSASLKAGSSSRSHLVTPASPVGFGAASDSDEEWEAVPPPPSSSIVLDRIDTEEGEEIDMNAFQAELDEHLEAADEESLAAAVSPEPETAPSGQPMSLNEFASAEAADGSQDDEEFFSSSESDED